tara:strand:- start:9285 stop:9959 length:675 start_codon:yes stop_codon:yes gene_type:complete
MTKKFVLNVFYFKLLLLFNLAIFSQEEVKKVEIVSTDNQIVELFDKLGDKEIKLDITDLIIFPAFEFTFEKIQDPYSSIGLGLFLNLSDHNSSNRNWSDVVTITPFYRFYFFNKKDYGGAGFFAEIFSKFSFAKQDVLYYNPDLSFEEMYNTEEENFFDIAPGASIGQKWLNRKGWTFEVSVGFGRFLLNNYDEDIPVDGSGREISSSRPQAAFRGGFTIGKRF